MTFAFVIEKDNPDAVKTAISTEARRWADLLRSQKLTTGSKAKRTVMEEKALLLENFAEHVDRIILEKG